MWTFVCLFHLLGMGWSVFITDASPYSDSTLIWSAAEKFSTLSSGEPFSEARSKFGSSFTDAVTSHLKQKFYKTKNTLNITSFECLQQDQIWEPLSHYEFFGRLECSQQFARDMMQKSDFLSKKWIIFRFNFGPYFDKTLRHYWGSGRKIPIFNSEL